MTRYFVDTSALVKRYHTEPGSQHRPNEVSHFADRL